MREPGGPLAGRWQQADGEGSKAHQNERCNQDRLAAELVAEVATDDATQRTGSEADAEGREGGQGARYRVAPGKNAVPKYSAAAVPKPMKS